MKNKIVDVVFKKFQSYSFIIFLALIVVAFIIIAQLNRSEDAPVDTQPKNTQPTNQPADEVFKLPIDAESPQVARNFWHSELSTEEQYQAIIKVGNTFRHNTGIDYTIDKETEFNVLASLSGTVSKVNQDSLLGYVVEIEHLDGIKTSYSSLGSVDVAVGDKVKQGDILGKAGSNNFDQASGVHVHFEVLKGAIKLNPNELIGMKISEINYE